jgi:hypothetical protein
MIASGTSEMNAVTTRLLLIGHVGSDRKLPNIVLHEVDLWRQQFGPYDRAATLAPHI